MEKINPIPVEGTNLSFYTTYDDENGWGFVIMNVPITSKRTDNGYSSEETAKDEAIKLIREISTKKGKIYIYDLHRISLIYDLRSQIEKIYEVIWISTLNDIADEECIVSISPLCIKQEKHWEEIKRFVSTHTKAKIIMLVQDECKTKVEGFIGHHENITILDRDLVLNFDEVINTIMK